MLIVSGGHTLIVVMEDHGRYRVAGQTVDDAAGEAFDKVARFLGLGYPGGPAIDRLATAGDRRRDRASRVRCAAEPDFSFAGLKTAVVNHVRKTPDASVADVAASFQEAVVDQLVDKLFAVADDVGAPTRGDRRRGGGELAPAGPGGGGGRAAPGAGSSCRRVSSAPTTGR